MSNHATIVLDNRRYLWVILRQSCYQSAANRSIFVDRSLCLTSQNKNSWPNQDRLRLHDCHSNGKSQLECDWGISRLGDDSGRNDITACKIIIIMLTCNLYLTITFWTICLDGIHSNLMFDRQINGINDVQLIFIFWVLWR